MDVKPAVPGGSPAAAGPSGRTGRRAASMPEEEARQAAGQFAALFVRQVLKAAQPSLNRSGLLGGGFAGEVFGDMFLQFLAEKIAASDGLRLADLMVAKPGIADDASRSGGVFTPTWK